MTTVNTVAPVLAPIGSPVGTSFNYVGSVLSCTTGTWTTSAVTSYTYAWQRAGSAISGATSQLYTLDLADVGQVISCDITATGAETVVANSNRIIGLSSTTNYVEVFMWGGGGGGGSELSWSYGSNGGAGGAAYGFMTINTNTSYIVKVGGAGRPIPGRVADNLGRTAINGGGIGSGAGSDNNYGGGGGGFSGIFTTTAASVVGTTYITTISTQTAIIMAGGGGGGGSDNTATGPTFASGGAGGGSSGEKGYPSTGIRYYTGGSGGSQLGGGFNTATNMTTYGGNGTALQGGNAGNANYGGGGGGGYYGGAAGSYVSGTIMGGGGGGSGYIHPTFIVGGVLYAGVGTTPGNPSHPFRGSYGAAGITTSSVVSLASTVGTTGTQGIVIIRYPMGSNVLMVGGTITNDLNYYYHTFTQDSYLFKFGPSPLVGTTNAYKIGNTNVDLLLVGGGGGGGSDMGGGGGAGGYISTVDSLPAGNYTITVGAGGNGAPAGASQPRGSIGSDSSFLPSSVPVTYSYFFDTVGDYLSIPYDTSWNIGANDASIECWVWVYKLGVANSFFGQNSGATSTLRIGMNSSNLFWWSINNDTVRYGSPTNTAVAQTWYHLVLTISGGTGRFFINGVLRDAQSSLGSVITKAEAMQVGGEDTWQLDGYISNFRFINGGIPTSYQTSSLTVGTSVFSVPTSILTTTSQGATASYVKILTCNSSTLINSTTSTVITVNGEVLPTRWSPFSAYNAFTYVAAGGGGGGSEYNVVTFSASSGGSGGGSAANVTVYALTQFGKGIAGQGNNGAWSGGSWYGGGGGGAATTGTVASSSIGGNGGSGWPNAILGPTYYWAGGGGASGHTNISGNGGMGGGGGGAPFVQLGGAGPYGGYGDENGINVASSGTVGTLNAQTNVPGGNAATNTGGGGGGGAHYNANNYGGNGGSGVVVIRYIGAQRATGGTVYTYTTGTVTYTAHAFFSSGVFSLPYNNLYSQQNGGIGNPYGGGGGGAGGYNSYGGNGGSGVTLSGGTAGGGGGGGGGGASVADATGGGGGVDVYGKSLSGAAVSIGASGLGGSPFNRGGQPALDGNGGLYGGGGAGGQVVTLDSLKGNGARGALLIIYTGTTYTYPNPMPNVLNAVAAPNSTFDINTTATDRISLPYQFDNIITSNQDLQYSTNAIGIPIVVDIEDIISTKESQTSAIIATNLQVITYITDHEMMLKNSDPALPADYANPGNYQFVQEVTPLNDPRLITVRLKNYVIGVTGETGDSTTTGKQTWY